MRKVTFYHAGCPVCISAEDDILELVNSNTYIHLVHLGEEKQLIKQAEDLGVKISTCLSYKLRECTSYQFWSKYR